MGKRSRRTRWTSVALFLAAVCAAPSRGGAQSQATVPSPAVSVEEAAKITSGWALIAQGRQQEAVDYALSVLTQFPRSPAALTLAIEAVIAGRGAFSSLDVYERWLDGRAADEPFVLRRISAAFLFEWARQTTDVTARMDALKALVGEGVTEAAAVLADGAGAGGIAESRALVALGNAQAIDRTVSQMKAAPGLKLTQILTLAESRSPLVVQPLVDVLGDEKPENRAAAADALGRIGRQEAVAPLKARLDDADGRVRLSVAGALLRLGDSSGIELVRGLAASEFALVRRSAAILLASQPDDAWKALVRGLASDPDPSIRVDAARLLAPHDPEFSQILLDGLLNDANPEIRDRAGLAMAETAPVTSLPALRRLMRVGSGRVRVAAADRVLKATR
jgi:HEAT repeat protein